MITSSSTCLCSLSRQFNADPTTHWAISKIRGTPHLNIKISRLEFWLKVGISKKNCGKNWEFIFFNVKRVKTLEFPVVVLKTVKMWEFPYLFTTATKKVREIFF